MLRFAVSSFPFSASPLTSVRPAAGGGLEMQPAETPGERSRVVETRFERAVVSESQVYDITIIGAGPAGLFGAFYAGMRQMSTKVVDGLEEVGGQLTALYPEKYIYDMPGFPKVKAKDLVREQAEQGLQYGAEVCLGEKIVDLARDSDGLWRLVSEK